MKKFALAIPLALLATPTLAADAVVYDDPMPIAAEAVSDWSGFYAGVQLGYAFGDTGTFQLDPFTPGLQTAFAPGFSGDFNDGVIGGVHVGYDWQFGSIVVGGILDVTGTDISDDQNGFSVTPARYTITRELDLLATLRARLGYAVSDRVLLYGTGGLAYGDVDFSYEQPGSAAVTTTSGGQDSDFGYTVGAGVEGKVTEKISVGIEYLYTNLGGNDFTANLTGGPFGAAPGTDGTGSDDDFDFHSVQLKVSYRF